MKHSILSLLEKAGLEKKEALLYVAGIDLGEAPVSQLATYAGLKRSTAYFVAQTLEEKGLFTMVEKRGKRWYAPEDPEKVLILLKVQQATFAKALPELATLYRSGSRKPRVRFFEGVDGIKQMYMETLDSKGAILVYASITDMFTVVSRDWKKSYVQERMKRKIFTKCITPDTPEALEYMKQDREEWREMLLIPAAAFPFSNEINIFNDKVAIFSFKEKIGVIIESKEIAETQRKIFELAWMGAVRAREKAS